MAKDFVRLVVGRDVRTMTRKLAAMRDTSMDQALRDLLEREVEPNFFNKQDEKPKQKKPRSFISF